MNKIIVNQYVANSPLLSKEQRVAFLSDIHGDDTKLETIIEVLKNLRVSMILLGGDVIDSNKDKRNDKIKELLQELSKTVEIFLSIGNHDVIYFDKDSNGKRCEVESKDLDFWKQLSSLKEKNIHLPSMPNGNPTMDKWSFSNDIDITALNMPIGYYTRREHEKEFMEYIDMFSGMNINTEKFNILLCHSPNNIIKDGQISDYLDYLKKFNLILSGHMHAGLVPNCFRNSKHGGGLVGPYASFFPKHSYGFIENDGTVSLTSGGVTKIATSSEIGSITNKEIVKKAIDFIFPPEVEIIDLNPGEETKFTKIKQSIERIKR